MLVAGEAGIGKTRLVSELADRARRAGAVVLSGRCIDLVGTGMPYLAFVDAFRPLGGSTLRQDWPAGFGNLSGPVSDAAERNGVVAVERDAADHRLRLFEEVRATLDGLGAGAPLVLVLEDVHWADTSTLDLVSFLAHAIGDSSILMLVTYRSDEARPHDVLSRLATGLLRARVATTVELGPLPRDELGVLLEQRAERAVPVDLAEAIYGRSGGNPFFAEELLAAAVRGEQALPGVVRDALLQRVAGLDDGSRTVVRVAAAAGREVAYRLLVVVVGMSEPLLRRALRQAVDHHVLVAEQATGTFRFRHALLAEAVYATLLPGEREDLHGRLATALSEEPRLGTVSAVAGELAQHWVAAGRPVEALAACMRAAQDAEAVSGLAEALRHLEGVLEFWPRVRTAEEITGTPLAAVLAHAAELADRTGSGPRAADLARRAIALLDEDVEPVRAALLYERLGSYLLPIGDRAAGLAAFRRAVDLISPQPPSAEQARVLAALGNALMLSWRHSDSRAVCDAAIAVAAAVGDDRPALRARDVLGTNLCYLGRPDDGLQLLFDACARADEREVSDVLRPYVLLSDALITVGRLREAAEIADRGLAVARRLGVERGWGNVLAANAAEARLGAGDWVGAEEVLAAALRRGGNYWSYHLHVLRADLATGRAEFDVARHHLDAGSQAAREPSAAPAYACRLAELALWEGRVDAAATAIDEGLRSIPAQGAAFMRARVCALGLRAEVERAQSAALRRDQAAVDAIRQRADDLMEDARRSAAAAAAVTPDAAAWLAVAEAEHGRVQRNVDPRRWQDAASAWEGLDRPYAAAYCLWRCAEALLATGASATDAAVPARAAHRTAVRLGARSLQHELELLAQRARLRLDVADARDRPDPEYPLGLTAREIEVLERLALGYTNREIAAELTISVKTASVHVSHILSKLGVSSRIEAAAIAHRLHPSSADR